MSTKKINYEYNLNASQANDCEGEAKYAFEKWLKENDLDFVLGQYEIWEDGISVQFGEDELAEETNGNYDTIADFVRDLDDRYLEFYRAEAVKINAIAPK